MLERENGDYRVLEERLNNFMQESEADRNHLRVQLSEMQKQTHDWMQAMLNRLPPWAVGIGLLGASALGSMAMYILTHK